MKKLGCIFALAIIVLAAVFGYQYWPSQQPQSTPSASIFQVTFLDVGQADAITIQSGDSTMLIDAGGNSTADSLVKTLQTMGFNKFDVVIGTHPHEDHIGGLDAVINQFEIGTIYMPKVTATTKTFEDVIEAIEDKGLSVTTPVPGTSFNLGQAVCTLLAPNSQSYEDLNNYSIVIRIQYNQNCFLFMGDAETDSEKEILAKDFSVKADVLKVGHHGSSSSTSGSFLSSVNPQFAVIMVGKDNDYGHPHQETLDKLNSAGIGIYRTDLNGTITFTSDGTNLQVSTEK